METESLTPDAWDDLEGVRPPAQSLDLQGHGDTIRTLVRNYRAGRLHHAWLLSGPKGIGKATLAFRFAEYLLRNPDHQTAPEDFSAHNDTLHSQVSRGAHPNLLLLRRPWDQKAKKFLTRISVEEIRRTAHFLQTASGANAWRIVIVDPADDMTTSAANALLKILEEPPKRTIFFVLAHSPRGLLPTIRSRCQVLAAKPLCDTEMETVLRSQPLTADLDPDEMAKLIARAGGSARRALEFAGGDVLETFEAFLELVRGRKADIGQLHHLAGKLSPAAKSADFRLFTDLVNDHLTASLRDMAVNDQIPAARLNRIVDVWEGFRDENRRAETWNMDKKQVILNLFREMRSA